MKNSLKLESNRSADRRPRSKGRLLRLPIPAQEGIFVAHYSEIGLAEIDFPKATGGKPSKIGGRELESGASLTSPADRRRQANILRWHRTSTAALKAVLAGRAAKSLPPLDWTGKTDFQQAVWRELLKLRPGKTKSYVEIAAAIAKPKAVRAVGGACGANPIPVLVPCHRVLAADQKIGGFSGGLDWKCSLLAREGVKL